MAQRIPFVQVVLIFSLAILILSELVSTQEDCAAHANYCNEDPDADDLKPCCDGEKCVVTQDSKYCDCAPYGQRCDWLPCCKGLVCYAGGGGYCGYPCEGLDGDCAGDSFCCDDLYCTDTEGGSKCKPVGRTNGTTGMSNNGRTNGF